MTVLPVLLAAREFREKYQGGKLSEVGGRLKETNPGGAEAGRGGGAVGARSDSDDDLRLREGGESKAVFIGEAGGVFWGVVGVAGWTTIASFGETSKGVSWLVLESLRGGLDIVGEQSQATQVNDHEGIDAVVEAKTQMDARLCASATVVIFGQAPADPTSHRFDATKASAYVQRPWVLRRERVFSRRTRFMSFLLLRTFSF